MALGPLHSGFLFGPRAASWLYLRLPAGGLKYFSQLWHARCLIALMIGNRSILARDHANTDMAVLSVQRSFPQVGGLEMQHDPQYPHYADHSVIDVKEWCAATGVLPVHEGARVLRTGLAFFKFMLRRDERPEIWFQRFDIMLIEVNCVSGLDLSVAFQSGMLLPLLQLPPEQWFSLLNGLNHKLPSRRAEYVRLHKATLRQKILEGSALHLRQGSRNVPGSRAYFTAGGTTEPRPLYQCLGDPAGTEDASGSLAALLVSGGGVSVVDALDGHWPLSG